MTKAEACQPLADAIKPLRNAEIDAHPLLNRDQRAMCKLMRNTDGRRFRMFDFARVELHATASDYANADDDDIAERVKTEMALHRAALLFVYEALKACDHDIIKQWPDFDIMLQQLEDLNTLGFPR